MLSLILSVEDNSKSWPADAQENHLVISLLQKAGIDTDSPFWINNTGYVVINGVIQKSDIPCTPIVHERYSVPLGFFDYSSEDLNKLLERAYAQGMFTSSDNQGIDFYA